MINKDERNLSVVPLTLEESEIVSGGMINLYPEGGNPKGQDHQAGALVSIIGYRTFGDVGL
jgi:hypothetical protein